MKKTMRRMLVVVGAMLLSAGTVKVAAADVVPREGWRMLNGADALALAGEQVSVAGFDAAAWMPAKVPGTVLDNLVRNGKLPEPYWGLNNRKADGLIPDLGDGNRTYYTAWFRTEFDLPADWKGRGIWLRPEGINYRAEIWLNGKMVAFPSGMFACQTVDVSLFANPGARNALAVKVYPLDIPGDTRQWRTKGMMEYANGGDGLIGRNVTMLMSIGWDFTFRDGIRDRNTGIWKDMVFFATGDVRLDAPFVRTKLSDDLKSAELDISVEAINSNCDRWLFRGKAKGTLVIEVEGTPLRFKQDVTLHRGERRELHFKGSLANPRLWWPVNKGRPELYTLVCRAKTAHGEQVVRRRFGVREAYSDQSGKDGARQFWINKRRIFIRGTNWIPEAMLRTDDARMEAELRLTRQQGVNMVRLWGGGIVESDRFYDLCDEMGLLVWQEFFMTGDTAHPDDAALYLSCVSDQVKRIRHHASICHYVCSNESTEVDGIRELLERLDGTRSYMMQSECDGVHDGSPYFSLNPMRYYDDTASPRGSRVYGFNPEYGTAVLPTAECLREVLPEKDLWPINREAWAYRDGNNFYKSVTVHDDLVKCYGEATSLEDYCRRSQALDYHATRAIWNNVPLPKVVAYGWDYSLEPTPALFATQNALEPLHAQYDYLDDMVCLVNDLTEARSVEVSAAVYDFESRKVWEKSAPVTVPAERCVEAFKVEFPPLDKPHFIRLSVREAGREIASTFYWRSPEKYNPKTPDALTGPCTAGFAALSELPKTTLSVKTAKTEEEGNTMRVTVKNTGDRIAFLTRLALTGEDGRPIRPSFYSDNWFSLLPGEAKTVTVQHPARPCRLSVSAWNADPQRNSSVGTVPIALRHATLSAAVEDAHSNIVARFIGPEGLLRDYEGETPTPADCRDCRPNAMGWWSPIENGPMFTGPYLEAVCARARRTGAAEDRALAKKLAEGLVRAASVSDVKGMIVRGFGTDGVCHYPLGSEDQTIPWFYGLYAYWRSGIPSAAEKASVAAKVREVADALEANGWKCPCDGAFTGQTRGAFMDNGLVFRGAAHTLFLLRAVWEMTGEDKWLRHYDEALKRRQKATTLTMLEVCREGWATDVKKFNADGGGMWIYVCAQGCLARLAEMDPAHADDFRAGLARNAARARPAMASVTFSNVIERPFKYANWRTGYRWRPQKTQKDADDVQRTGDPAILGHRKQYERKTMTLPLSAAAVCAFAGAAREDVDRTLRIYDYSQINLCEFFLAEVAAERMFNCNM